MSRLIHYSAKPISPSWNLKNLGPHNHRPFNDKPRGLWVSVEGEDDWKSWCHGANFNLDGLRFAYQVVLLETCNILYIKTLEELDSFSQKFSYTPYELILGSHGDSRPWSIRWDEIAKTHDGIIIAPYQWQRRHEFMWYYTWDCASGCIWRAEKLRLEEIEP